MNEISLLEIKMRLPFHKLFRWRKSNNLQCTKSSQQDNNLHFYPDI